MFQPFRLFVQRVKDHNMVTVAIAVNEQEARKDMKMYGLYYDDKATIESYEISKDRVYNFMVAQPQSDKVDGKR